MSNIYVQEPPTEGKVCLETSVGDIDIELWSRECPKACRNFIQLCMEGYYDKTKFFRVVPNFIVQGGDPTNTGTGGESVWGKPFKDEFHSRLRFVRRGLVAMANAGKDDNGSQFFFTLAATKELQNKHTIFGKVAGDTIYNMIRLGEGQILDEDRPKYPQKIIKTKVLINPFDDITPRETIKQEIETSDKKEKKSKMKATKDYKLLSFGDEAEDDEESLEQVVHTSRGKSKSAHDLAKDPSLASDVDMTQITRADADDSSARPAEVSDEDDDEAKERLNSIRSKLSKRKSDVDSSKKDQKKKKVDYDEEDVDFEYENPFEAERRKKKEELEREFKALSKEYKKSGKEKKSAAADDAEEAPEADPEEAKNDMLRDYHNMQKKYRSKQNDLPKSKKDLKSREAQTMALLEKFKSKLSGLRQDNDDDDNEQKEDKAEGGQKDNEDDDEDDLSGTNWMKHSLKFEDSDPTLAKDANTKGDDWFDIYDPRNPLNKRRRENNKQEDSMKEKMRMKSQL